MPRGSGSSGKSSSSRGATNPPKTEINAAIKEATRIVEKDTYNDTDSLLIKAENILHTFPGTFNKADIDKFNYQKIIIKYNDILLNNSCK